MQSETTGLHDRQMRYWHVSAANVYKRYHVEAATLFVWTVLEITKRHLTCYLIEGLCAFCLSRASGSGAA